MYIIYYHTYIYILEVKFCVFAKYNLIMQR